MTLAQDLRFIGRMLVKRPGFSVIVVVTLALGIGINTTIFSFVNATVIRSFPFENPDRQVLIFGTVQKDVVELRGVSYPDYLDWVGESRSFDKIGAAWPQVMSVTDGDAAERVTVDFVSPGYFHALGVEPEMGRTFTEEESQLPRGAMVAVVGQGLWRSRYSSDPGLVGRNIEVNGQDFTVVGIMPEEYLGYEGDIDLWMPVTTATALLGNRRPQVYEARDARWLELIAQLKPGVTIAQAQAELDVICRRLQEQYPGTNADRSAQIFPLEDYMLGDYGETILLLWGAVGFVLLIVCANVANLLLMRAIGRDKEFAIRSSLGAGSGRMVRLLIAETMILALLGGSLGVVFGAWGIRVAAVLSPIDLPGYVTTEIDVVVLGFILALSLLTGLALAVAPAIRIMRSDLNGILKDKAAAGIRSGRLAGLSFHNALVTLEIAVALLVLLGAGLVIKSFENQRKIDPGFKTENLLAMRIQLPADKYSRDGAIAFARQLIERTESLPSVHGVGLSSDLPLMAEEARAALIAIEDHLAKDPESKVRVYHHRVNSGFFATMGISFLQGGLFSPPEAEREAPEVIVSRKLAELAWPGQNAIGERVIAAGRPYTVVGVVDDVRYRHLISDRGGNPEDPDVFLPLFENTPRVFGLVAKSEMDASGLTAALRKVVSALDPDVPVFDVKTMDQVVAGETRLSRFTAFLFGVFGILALLLAVVGVYGVMSYSVAQRTHEIGVRMALGAGRTTIYRQIVGEGARVLAVGVVAGLLGALAMRRVIASYLYEISATDPATIATILLVLVSVVGFVCYVAGHRATRVDPVVALRHE